MLGYNPEHTMDTMIGEGIEAFQLRINRRNSCESVYYEAYFGRTIRRKGKQNNEK